MLSYSFKAVNVTELGCEARPEGPPRMNLAPCHYMCVLGLVFGDKSQDLRRSLGPRSPSHCPCSRLRITHWGASWHI